MNNNKKIAKNISQSLIEISQNDNLKIIYFLKNLKIILNKFDIELYNYSPYNGILKDELLNKFCKTIKEKNFVNYLFKTNNLFNINEIYKQYLLKVYSEKNVIIINFITPFSLNKTLKCIVKKKFEKFFNKKISLNIIIDKKIIGGFIIKYGFNTIDFSIKKILKNFNNN